MTASYSSAPEFIVARIAEDEAADSEITNVGDKIRRASVLLMLEPLMDDCPHPWVSSDGRYKRMMGGWCFVCYDMLKLLAMEWKHHEDFDPEWLMHNRGNAEDCPTCLTDPSIGYPFLCKEADNG